MKTGNIDILGTLLGLTSSEVTTALGYTPSTQAASAVNGDIATVDGSGNVVDSGKVFDTDGTMAADSDTRIATQKAIVTYVASQLSEIVSGVSSVNGETGAITLENLDSTLTIGEQSGGIITFSLNLANPNTWTAVQKLPSLYADAGTITSDGSGNLTVAGTFTAESGNIYTLGGGSVYFNGNIASGTGIVDSTMSYGLLGTVIGTSPVNGFITFPTTSLMYVNIPLTVNGLVSANGLNLPSDPGAGALLVSDGSGNATWETVNYLSPVSMSSGENNIIAFLNGSGELVDSHLTVSTDGTLSDDSDEEIPTQKAVKTYADQLLAASAAMTYQGVMDLSSNPDYPAATVGNVWAVSVAGKIGGALGVSLSVGDLILCKVTNGGGNQALVGADFDTINVAINGIVVGPETSVVGDFAMFNSLTGSVLEDTGLSLSTDGTMAGDSDSLIPSQAAVVTYVNGQGFLTAGTLTSGDVETALGFTPYNSTNPDGYITSADISDKADKASMSSGENNIIALLDSTGDLVDSHVTISTDGTMADDSDSLVPTQKAVVTYVAAQISDLDLSSSYVSTSRLLTGTFTNGTLSSHVLTITHSLGLSAPYTAFVVIFDNTGSQILPDSVVGSANSVNVDLTSYGTLTGTWGYKLLA